MAIEFLCPNGHKIRCGDDRVGKPAKCPKCGVRFYVPDSEESEPSDSGSWATASVQMSHAPGSGSGSNVKKGQFEFLCPNGHRVWAPIELQGRAGQCPDCGSKFHIPNLDDFEPSAGASGPTPSPDDSVVNLESGFLNGSGSARGSGLLNLAVSPPGPDRVSRLLADLAEDLPDGAAISLHLADGTSLTPGRFAVDLCDTDRLVFSVSTGDDVHTLHFVPWHAIARVEVTGISQLPLEFRE